MATPVWLCTNANTSPQRGKDKDSIGIVPVALVTGFDIIYVLHIKRSKCI